MRGRGVALVTVAVLMGAFLQWLAGRGHESPATSPGSGESVSGVKKDVMGSDASLNAVGRPSRVAKAAVTDADRAKARVLDQILASKNDNDPRLDREFNGLSDGAKELLKSRYGAYGAERRNERGTIVFLLGRNLTSEADFQFLRDVLDEAPCLSLENCARDTAGGAGAEDLHHEAGTEVTLAYPQLVALKSLENYLFGAQADARLRQTALAELEGARRSKVARVAAVAEEIYSRYVSRK